MFRNLKIKQRIFLLLGFTSLLMLTIGLMGIYALHDSNRGLKTVYEDRTVCLGQISDMMRHNLRIRVNIANMLIVQTDAETSQREAKINGDLAGIAETWKEYIATYLTPEEKTLAEKTEKDRAEYREQAMYPVLKLVKAKRFKDAAALFNGKYRDYYNTVEKDWDDLAQLQIRVAKEEYEKQTKEYALFRILAILLIIGGMALAFSAGWWMVAALIRSVNSVKNAAEAAARGDLSKEAVVSGNDEIGQMAVSFNTMITNVKRVVEQINSATGTLAASSEELSATSEELSKGSNDLATQTEQVVTAMTEVSQTIMDMAKNASQAADASKTTSETATKGQQVIQTTTEGMTSIATTVQGAATTIEELGKSSAQIGEIVATINGIADQTNLLALNAAIEAARAGEQGRGFAVVADEVRKLAERTSQATKDIGQRITAIQQAAAESVDAMKRGSDEVDKGVGLAQEASGSLNSIVTASSNATDMVQRIAAATEQQSAATEEVSQNMETISGISRQSAASTEQIKASAEGLARLAVDLRETASWFKMNGSSMDRAVPSASFREQASYSPALALPSPSSSAALISDLSRDSRSGKLIDWNTNLSVHIHEIDDQHKVLIGIINDMYDALKAARGKEAVETILPRLVEYTVTHFANEERLMEKHGYPGYLSHKSLHEALKGQVGEYANRLKEGRSTAGVEFMAFLKDWLTKHIMGVDMKYSPHLRKKGLA